MEEFLALFASLTPASKSEAGETDWWNVVIAPYSVYQRIHKSKYQTHSASKLVGGIASHQYLKVDYLKDRC